MASLTACLVRCIINPVDELLLGKSWERAAQIRYRETEGYKWTFFQVPMHCTLALGFTAILNSPSSSHIAS